MVLKKKSLNRQQATSKISQHVPPSSDPRDIASRSATSLSNIIVRPLIAAAGSLRKQFHKSRDCWTQKFKNCPTLVRGWLYLTDCQSVLKCVVTTISFSNGK